MEPLFDAASEGYSAGTTQLVIPHTCTGSNRYLRVGLVFDESVTITSATYASVALTQVQLNDQSGANMRLVELGLVAPATGTNTVVINFSASTEVWWGVVSYTVVDQSTPRGDVQQGGATSGRSDAVNVSSAAGKLVVGLAGTTSNSLDGDADQTTRAIKDPQANGEYNGVMDEEPGDEIVQMGYSWNLNRFASIIALSLNGVAGPITGTGTATLPALGAGSEPQQVSGTGTATLPLFGVQGIANDAVFSDDFVGPDGSPPDPNRWELPGGSAGTFTIDLQGNRLHLFIEASSNAEPVANVLLTDGGVECDVEVPPAGGNDRFFLTIGLRANPLDPSEAYLAHIFRSNSGEALRWRLQKFVDGVNTSISTDTTLDNDVLRYRVRFEVEDEAPATLRASVRDYSLGPIPPGSWDKTETDTEPALAGPGAARINLTKLAGDDPASVFVDRWQVFDLAPAGPASGTGAVTLPTLAAAGTAGSPPEPIAGSGNITLPSLTVHAHEFEVPFLDDLVSEYGWLLTPDDQGITFRHLLNMTSGYGYAADSPGEAFAYGNSGEGLLSQTLRHLVGGELDNIAVPLLAPLQFEDTPSDIFDPTGTQGIINLMTPRDFARIGWMLANRGDWDGQQVVSQSFFAPLAEFGQLGSLFGHVQVANTVPRSVAAFTPGDYLDVSGFASPPENETAFGPGVFGLGWYLNGTAPGPVQQWADLPADTMVTTGIFGTAVLIIIPSEGLVIAVADPTTTDPADVLGNIAPPSSVDSQFNDTVALITDGITGTGQTPTFPGTTWTDITDAQAGISTTALDNFIAAVTFSGSTRGVITRNGYMVRTFGDQSTPVGWASSRKALYGVLVGALAFGDVVPALDPVLITTFTAPNDSSPDSDHWTTVTDGDGTATAEIQNDELELAVDATGASAATEAAVNSSPGTGALLDTQVDFEFRFPTGSTRCFSNIRLRKAIGVGAECYQLFLLRDNTGNQFARIVKQAATGQEDLTTDLALNSSQDHWRGRFQVVGTGPPAIKMAIQAFDGGPIAEDDWDEELNDPGTSAFITTANPIELANAEGPGESTAVQLDNVVVSEVVTPAAAVSGAGGAVLPALSAAGVGNQAVFNDDFVGPDGSPPDAVRWDVYGLGTFAVDRQGNRLHLDATGGSTTNSSNANAIAVLPELIADPRLEFDIELPPTGPTGEFFCTVALRMPPHTTQQDPESPGYRLFFSRNGTTAPLRVRIIKELGGVVTDITPDLDLSNSQLHYRVRWEAEGPELRAAVRDFDLGPIAEDDWDFDTSDSEITAAGTVRVRWVKGDAGGNRPVFIDHFQIFDLALPGANAIVGSGDAALPALVGSGQARAPVIGSGAATLAAVAASGTAAGTGGGSGMAVLPALGSQPTNLVSEPENFNAWTELGNPNPDVGGQPDPFGGNDAWHLGDNSDGFLEGLAFGITFTGDGDKGYSLFVQRGLSPHPAGFVVEIFNLTAGVTHHCQIVFDGGVPTELASPNATVLGFVAYPDGWFRALMQANGITAADTYEYRIFATNKNLTPEGDLFIFGATAHDEPIVAPYRTGGRGTVLLTASGSATLRALTATGTGAAAIQGAGTPALPMLQASGTISTSKTAAGSATLPAVAASAQATVNLSGSGTATLPAIAAAGTAGSSTAAAGTATLPALETSGSGAVPMEGSGTAILPALIAAGTTATTNTGTGAVGLPALVGSGQARARLTVSGSATLAALEATGTGAGTGGATGNAIMPGIRVSGTGTVPLTGSGAAVLPALRASATTSLIVTGTGSTMLPALMVQATGAVAAGVHEFVLDVRVTQPFKLRVFTTQPGSLNIS